LADFNTHIFSAAAASSLAATLSGKLLSISMPAALMLVAAGTIGGVLPDIDLKYSMPSRLLFSMLGLLTALAWLFSHMDAHTALELWLIALGIFLVLRYPMWWLFHTFTVHRGVLHSVLAAAMWGVLAAAAVHRTLSVDAQLSWLIAIFLATGYLLHLLLDELYSVDFMGVRIKRSFGSALKLLDTRQLPASCLVLFILLVAWFWTPELDSLTSLPSMLEDDWTDALWPDWLTSRLAKPTA